MISRNSYSSRAFTLIELLVVIVILGILMAVAVPTFLKQQQKAQDSKTQQQLTTAYKAIRSGLSEFNNQYPSVASVVSVISQSEPELTVSSGACTASTSDKQVVVDNVLTGPGKLALYAKSSSGSFWQLSASASSAPAFTKLGTCLGPLAKATATVSGNETTDATRAAATQGDGRSPDSSVGIWQGTTNLVPNSNFETNLSGWNQSGSGTLSRVTTMAKFGSAAGEIDKTGSSYVQPGTNLLPASPNTVYTASVWLYEPASINASQLTLRIEAFDSTSTFISRAGHTGWTTGDEGTAGGRWQPPSNQTGAWFRYSATLPATPAATAYLKVSFLADGSQIASPLVYIDAVQLEQSAFPTPYVSTNGSAATRNASRVQISASALNTTQGWVALRVRLEHSSASTPALYPCFFWWGDDLSHQIRLDFHSAQSAWELLRWNGSNIGGAQINATYNVGDEVTLIGTWSATQVGISVNGSAFTYMADTAIPAGGVMPANVDVGQYGGAAYLDQRVADSDILWQAMGTGTISNADAATINSWGDTDPSPNTFSSSAQAKETWSADDSTVITG